MKAKNVTVKQDPENEIPFEIMAKAIEQVSRSMEAIAKTRVSRKMLVALESVYLKKREAKS